MDEHHEETTAEKTKRRVHEDIDKLLEEQPGKVIEFIKTTKKD
jgi:hypothetical protein